MAERNVVGVDIGSAYIKVVALRRGDIGYGITALGIASTPGAPGRALDGDAAGEAPRGEGGREVSTESRELRLRDRREATRAESREDGGRDAIARSLRELVSRMGLSRARCAVGVGGDAVAPRAFRITPRPNESESAAVRREAAETVPFLPRETALDYVTFAPAAPEAMPGNGRDTGAGALHVATSATNATAAKAATAPTAAAALADLDDELDGLLVAARARDLDRAVRIATLAGLDPVIVDFDGLAVANCFLEAGRGAEPEVPTLLLNIGRRTTNMVVLEPNGRVHSRDIRYAGDTMTSAVSDCLAMRSEKAERLKAGDDPLEAVPFANLKLLAQEQSALLRRGLADLMREVKETLRFFAAQRLVHAVDECWVTGGAAMFPGLPQFVAAQLGVPTKGWNPLYDYDTRNAKPPIEPAKVTAHGPRYTVALGLALRRDPS